MLEIVALVGAARADTAARHAHAVLADVRVRRRSGFALAQCQVHARRRDLLLLREGEQLAQQVLGVHCLRAAHAERVAAAVNRDVEPALQQPQVLVERSAEIGEARVVGRRELEFPPRFGRCSRHGSAAGRGARRDGHGARRAVAVSLRQPAAQAVRVRRGDQHVGKTADERWGPAKFTQRLLAVRPASSRAVALRQALDQYALHACRPCAR